MSTTTSLLTFEQFERLPDTGEPGKCELLEGELIQLPPAKVKHMTAAERLFVVFIQWVGPARIGEVHIEMGYKLGRNTWQIPDVSVAYPDQQRGDYLNGAPLLAVEVVSESNRASYMDRKVRIYLEHGAQQVWVMYPEPRSVWVFGTEAPCEFHGVLTSRILPNLEIDLEAVFG